MNQQELDNAMKTKKSIIESLEYNNAFDDILVRETKNQYTGLDRHVMRTVVFYDGEPLTKSQLMRKSISHLKSIYIRICIDNDLINEDLNDDDDDDDDE